MAQEEFAIFQERDVDLTLDDIKFLTSGTKMTEDQMDLVVTKLLELHVKIRNLLIPKYFFFSPQRHFGSRGICNFPRTRCRFNIRRYKIPDLWYQNDRGPNGFGCNKTPRIACQNFHAPSRRRRKGKKSLARCLLAGQAKLYNLKITVVVIVQGLLTGFDIF